MNFAMNSTMTTMQAAGNVAGNPAPAAATTTPGAATPDALVPAAGTASTAAPGQAPAPAAALPFGHWIALDRALPDVTATMPPQGDVAAPDAAAGEAEAAVEEDVVPDVLLGAMAPMLAPAGLPAMMLAMQAAKPGVAGNGAGAPSDDAAGGPVAGAPDAVTQVIGARATPAAANVLSAAAPSIQPSAVQAASVPAAAAAAGPGPGAPQPVTAQPNAMPAAAPVSGKAAGEAAAEASADATPVTAAPGVNAAGTPPASARGADSLVLAGPPTAWRQNLHEALGERLQLQVGRNIDQATIRLEPPMLGRIDIAIRHSGGNLEIHIAASNSDVLRQLNAVSDSLRSDLAGRQYSSVSVNVSDVLRMQASTQAGGQTPGQGQADSQGRSRQEQEQARAPGRALHDEAATGTTLFSMN